MNNSPEQKPPQPEAAQRKPRILPGTLRQKAWLAMQIKGKFSVSDLVRNALPSGSERGDGSPPHKGTRNPRNNIGHYVRALCLAGVLAEMKRRLPPTSPSSNGEKRWVLVRDLGRRAPVVRANGQVFDPNSGAVLEVAGETVSEAGGGHVE